MSATDELKRLLDERGVKHIDHYFDTAWTVDGVIHMAHERLNGTLVVDNLTPEQAITATLGTKMLGCGKLTEEQVREAIRKYAEDDSCYIFEVYGEMCGLIANELNAMLDGGECEFKPFRGPISDMDEIGDRQGVCSECSAYMHEQFNFCPNCGRKAVKR